MTVQKNIYFLLLLPFLFSCDKAFVTKTMQPVNQKLGLGNDANSPSGPPTNPGDNGGGQSPLPQNPEDSFQLSICSALNFSQLTWPTALTNPQRNWFALALNVTGSFEGPLSWSTIANNFDGMGMSLGLLQQNFGSGTLQPLLIEMKKNDPENFTSTFSAQHVQSVNAMLQQWESALSLNELAMNIELKENFLFYPDELSISDLDDDALTGELSTLAVSKNQISVNWAVKNLYNGKLFKADWKSEFTALAEKPYYRSLQLNEANKYQQRALEYFNQFRFTQLRFYLLMYDFVVQNGGFKESHWNQFQSYVKQYPNSSEEQRARKLIEIRVATVRSEYKDDVNSRKSTIVTGQGRVHGSSRILPREYCYNPLMLLL